MQKAEGILLKMSPEYYLSSGEENAVVRYRLDLGGGEIDMNSLLGKELDLVWQHEIICIRCGRKTKTSFAQGYCYPCFLAAPETDACVLWPELCRAHEGISRDMDWSAGHCLIDHFVYLALVSGVKVGVTRHTQIPVRWIDQGAWKAIRLARTPDRHTAGLIEVALKEFFTDKTNWRDMLKDVHDESTDLLKEKDRAAALLQEVYRHFLSDDDNIVTINYPVLAYPQKTTLLNLDKNDSYSGTLTGIRGQYLIFGDGTVINVRKHSGYRISLSY